MTMFVIMHLFAKEINKNPILMNNSCPPFESSKREKRLSPCPFFSFGLNSKTSKTRIQFVHLSKYIRDYRRSLATSCCFGQFMYTIKI